MSPSLSFRRFIVPNLFFFRKFSKSPIYSSFVNCSISILSLLFFLFLLASLLCYTFFYTPPFIQRNIASNHSKCHWPLTRKCWLDENRSSTSWCTGGKTHVSVFPTLNITQNCRQARETGGRHLFLHVAVRAAMQSTALTQLTQCVSWSFCLSCLLFLFIFHSGK